MGLGTLRLLLSLMVIDAHYGAFRTLIQPSIVSTFGIDRVAFVGEGGVAIAGFFVISGYVIALVLTQKYDPRSWHGVGVFLAGRALRIYPLYLLVFILYWLATSTLGEPPRFSVSALIDNLLLLPSGLYALLGDHVRLGPIQMTGHYFIGPAWTLSFDLLLYVIAPFLLIDKRALWLAWLLGLFYFLAFIVTLDPRPPFWFASLYTSPIVYTFAFTCGALVFHYRERFVPGLRSLLAAALLVAVLTYFPLGFTSTAFNQLLAILALTVLVAGLKEFGKGRRHDRFFGDLTYATYLVHVPLLLLFERAGAGYPAPLALVATYALGAALLVAFEYPMDRLRDRLHARIDRPAVAASRTFRAIAALLMIMLVAAAATSYVRNGIGAPPRTILRTADCPAAWNCRAGDGAAEIDIHGAGAVTLLPLLSPTSRIVLDMVNTGTTGSVEMGLHVTSRSVFVGIRRDGAQCSLVVDVAGRPAPAAIGWNDDCSLTHRIVLDASAGNLVVAVDSLWVHALDRIAGEVSLVVNAADGSDGIARLIGVVGK